MLGNPPNQSQKSSVSTPWQKERESGWERERERDDKYQPNKQHLTPTVYTCTCTVQNNYDFKFQWYEKTYMYSVLCTIIFIGYHVIIIHVHVHV